MDPAHNGSGAMFDRIARRYDLLNRLLSLGADQCWRMRAVEALALCGEVRVLDVGTGTADLAIAIAKRFAGARVVGVDPSPRMLALARMKCCKAGLADRVALVEGDAQQLPFCDEVFDAVSIAFGIRNVPDRGQALREMVRVTRPGGRVAVLELTNPRGGLLASLARFYVHQVVPVVGRWWGRGQEYRYLSRSIALFPTPADFVATMEAAGLSVLAVERMTMGACTLFLAHRPSKGARRTRSILNIPEGENQALSI